MPYDAKDLKYDDCKICRAIASPVEFGMDSEVWNNSTWFLAHASVEHHGHNEIVGCYTRHDFQFRVAELHSLQHHIRTVLKKHDSLFIPEIIDGHFFFHIIHPNSAYIESKFGGLKAILPTNTMN